VKRALHKVKSQGATFLVLLLARFATYLLPLLGILKQSIGICVSLVLIKRSMAVAQSHIALELTKTRLQPQLHLWREITLLLSQLETLPTSNALLVPKANLPKTIASNLHCLCHKFPIPTI
jgi:hypothetical protein